MPGSRESRGRRWQISADAFGQVFGLDEQLAERRMREVVARQRQRDLDVAGDVDLAHAIAVIDELQQPHFDVVLGRDGDFELRGDLLGRRIEHRDVRLEGREVAIRLAPGRQIGRRPDRAAAHVAQVDVLAAGIGASHRAATCVTIMRSLKLAPPPALVIAAAYLPFDRNCVCGITVCGVR